MGRFLLGVVVLLACVSPLAWASVRMGRRFAPELPAPVARLFEAISTILLLLLICEVLGTVGLLYAWAIVVASVGFGAGIALGLGVGTARRSRSGLPRPSTAALAALAVAVGALVAGNAVLLLAALRTGSPDFDTQWFHLPFAAAFAQQHSITALHFVGPADLHQFFPANVELLHAVGMLAFGRDVLSIIVNAGFLALALLGAWCLGRARGQSALSALAVVVVLTVPQILYMSTGSAMDDVPALAFGLAAVALLAHAGGNRMLLLAVAVAAGLAAGTKATTLGFAIALVIGAWLTQPRERRRMAAIPLISGLALGCGYWYLRNLVAVGNPLPGSLGFLPSPHFTDQWGTLVHQLRQGTLTAGAVKHAFDFAFGPLWWALVALTIGGLALGLTRVRWGWERAASIAAVANAVAFAFSPFGNLPVNSRFLALTLAIGLCMLVTAPAVTARREARVGVSVALLVLIATQVKRYGGFAGGPLALGFLAGAAGLLLVALRKRPQLLGRLLFAGTVRRTVALTTPVLLVVLFAGSYAEAHRYLRHRYHYRATASLSGDPRRVGLKHAFAWAQYVQHTRIGFVGTDLNYALYGADLSNTVTPVGIRTPHGGLRLPHTCQEWRQTVNRGRYAYLLVAPPSLRSPTPPELSWLESDTSAVQIVLRAGGGVLVLGISGPLHPQTCTDAMLGIGH